MEKVITAMEITERGSTDSAKANIISAYRRKEYSAEALGPKNRQDLEDSMPSDGISLVTTSILC